jgi:hypothetical protein
MVEIVKGMKASVDNPSNPGYATTGAKGIDMSG